MNKNVLWLDVDENGWCLEGLDVDDYIERLKVNILWLSDVTDTGLALPQLEEDESRAVLMLTSFNEEPVIREDKSGFAFNENAAVFKRPEGDCRLRESYFFVFDKSIGYAEMVKQALLNSRLVKDAELPATVVLDEDLIEKHNKSRSEAHPHLKQGVFAVVHHGVQGRVSCKEVDGWVAAEAAKPVLHRV